MRLIETGDSTLTVDCPEYSQAMHSLSGAYEEALLKHVYPSKILEKGDNIAVLDTGFGIGYNTLALIDAASKLLHPPVIKIHALEFDRRYLSLMKMIRFNDTRDLTYSQIIRFFEGVPREEDFYKIEFHFGDARETLQRFREETFDAVFHDPFSPSKNPELWTVEFFSITAMSMKKDAILTTYSSAPQVRGAMTASGLKTGRGPSVGPKREGTIAGRQSVPDPITGRELKDLLRDPASIPYRDPGLNLTREEILENRSREKVNYKKSSSSSSTLPRSELFFF